VFITRMPHTNDPLRHSYVPSFPYSLCKDKYDITTPPPSRNMFISLQDICGAGVAESVERPRDRSSSPGRAKNFLFTTSSRPVLNPTQPPIQWIPGALSPGVKRRGVKLTTHLQLVLRSKIRGSIRPLPHTRSWRSAELVKHRNNFAFLQEI
jgi:hypothetical protein